MAQIFHKSPWGRGQGTRHWTVLEGNVLCGYISQLWLL